MGNDSIPTCYFAALGLDGFIVRFPRFVPPALHTWAIIISRASGT
jgi:hypothetical protein